MRDFPPELAILREKVFRKLEKVFQRFGFDPIDTPIVEYWEVLKGKYGGEAEEKLIWRFKLPYSEREYALRYDLTVPLARYFARFRPKLPFKRYYIGRVYRYDNPQKGRYREFWQADFDIIGCLTPEADAEVLNIVDTVFSELGFRGYVIRLNDRRLLKGIFEEELGLSGSIVLEVYRVIDKLDKVGLEGVKEDLRKLGLSDAIVDRIIELIGIKGGEEVLDNVEAKYGRNTDVNVALGYIRDILDLVYNPRNMVVDLSLVRGLDYYTGMIYEVWLKEFNRSLSGGGRYDDLIGIFMGKSVPAVGGSIGIEPLLDVGLEQGIFSLDTVTYTQVAVVYIGGVFKEAWRISRILRELGYNVYIDLARRDFKKQIKYIAEKNIRYLIIVGERDLKEGKVTFQDRETRERILIDLEKLSDILKERIMN